MEKVLTNGIKLHCTETILSEQTENANETLPKLPEILCKKRHNALLLLLYADSELKSIGDVLDLCVLPIRRLY